MGLVTRGRIFNYSRIIKPGVFQFIPKTTPMKSLLPVLLVSFVAGSYAQPVSCGLTAVYEHQRKLVKLKWSHTNPRVIAYVIQGSSDNKNWLTVHQLRFSKTQEARFLSYSDATVATGKNYYRLKSILKDGSFTLSSPITVIIGEPGNNWLMYPVPVRDVLNLQYNGNELIRGVISVFIRHTNGRVFHKLRYASSTRQIQVPVSNLGRGTYDIRIMVNDQLVWNQRFTK